jgi:hypothetical protein
MIDDEKVAVKLSKTLLHCGAEINESIRFVQSNCTDQEFKAYRKAMGKIMGEIYDEGLKPIYNKHPDLKPEGFD